MDDLIITRGNIADALRRETTLLATDTLAASDDRSLTRISTLAKSLDRVQRVITAAGSQSSSGELELENEELKQEVARLRRELDEAARESDVLREIVATTVLFGAKQQED